MSSSPLFSPCLPIRLSIRPPLTGPLTGCIAKGWTARHAKTVTASHVTDGFQGKALSARLELPSEQEAGIV
ncbi:hypothetical protein CEXT_202431 [Caerostris extrusa]|uniref:Uncharacterized protein n=1 Tax=Caerostris extrusa TaxID=172846 RepID=A0AAV4R7S6_CAEEX|nr:hypothetical protein CEXT_202431 [Caerostris extrusa]